MSNSREPLVGLLADAGPELAVGLLGILKSGAALVPLSPAQPDERLALIAADCGLDALVTERRYLERARRLVPCEVICIDEIADLGEDGLPSPPEESLAYVIYTSGSTGLPKGVGVSHANMVPMLDWSRQYFGLDESRRVLQSLSYAFDFGLWEILTTLISGGTFFVPGPEEAGDPEAYARLVREWEIDTVHATPSFFQAVAQAAGEPLERLRTLHLGGEALSRGQVERFAEAVGQECRQYNGYGPTEVTVNSLIFEVGKRGSLRGGERVPIGRASAYNEVYVLDHWGQPAPVGVYGELWVGGPGVARGYLGRPDLTAEKFVPDPFSAVPGARIYRTGDLVRWLASGDIEFLGRIDGQVKVRGFRIELGEVESVLRRHPGVHEAVVVARQDRTGSLALVGYVLGEASAEELRTFLRERLPEAMVPSAFMTLESLPLTSSGKVDRRALPEPSWGSASEGAAQAPRTQVEELLAGIWSEVLGLERVGLEESFFELGGHSLLATRLMSRVRQSFGVELPLRRLFEVSTVAGLAAEIETLLRNERQAGAPPLVRGAEEAEYPLSFAQERLWVLDRFEPGNPAYNMPAAVRLRGTLDVSALERGLAALVARHESLRTVFATRDGHAVQVVAEPGPVSLPVTDLTPLPAPERQGEAERIASGEALRPFDLARGPLLRARLIRTGADEHVLLLNLHHIVSDGWSLDVLVRELAALYAALCEGRLSTLPELPVRYVDYATWQRRWLSGAARETQLAYWRGQLAGAPQSIELPTDYPRPAVRTHGSGHVSRHVSGPVAEALLALGRREGASLFMVLLAAFKVLLHRLAGEEDIVIGSPIAGRGHRELEGLIGMFLNTLVLRTSLAGDPTVRELLARVRETALDAYAHQDVPFEMLLDELKPERDLSRTPLFQVFFNMLNLPAGEIRLPDLTLEGLPSPDMPSKFDLTLYVQPMAAGIEGIRFDMAYNGDLFEPQRIAEMLEQLASLLGRFGEDPEARIGSFSLLTPEAVAVLPDPRAPLGEEWWGPVHERLTLHARREPGRMALRDRNSAWTYGELEARSNRLAHELVAAGLRPEEPVAIYAHRSAALVWAVLGTLKAGGAFVILDPAYPAARLIETLKIAAPRAFLRLTEAGRLPVDLDAFLESLSGCIRLDLEPATPEERVLAGLAGEPPAVTVGPDDLALIAFTSGSTGLPKGILGRHGPLSHFLPWQVERLGMGADDHFSLLSGLSHDPLQRDIFTPLWVGGSIHIPDPLDMSTPGRLANWMRREEVSVAHLTPAMGQILTERPPGPPHVEDVEETELPALRRVLLVGDVLTRRDVVRLRQLAPGVTVVNLYGSTETQRSVGYHVVPEDGAADRAGKSREVLPLGQGMRDVQLLVLNRSGALAGIGEVGEICVRSHHLARGYLGDEALTRERFQVNPFTGRAGDRIYRTGDLGRYLPDGSVTFVARADQQVKIRGFRIEPGEIEARLGRLPGVREAIVLARGDSPGDKRLVAYVTPDPTAGEEPTAARMRSFLKERLPAYMVPAGFVVLDRLPVTPNGKVDRKALLQIDDRHRETDVDYKAPQTEAELIIASTLQEVLKIDRIGVDDNFFDLGGNSLLLVQVHGRLQEQFGREILLVEIFNHPTVRALAAHLEGGKGAAALSTPDSARTDQLLQGRDRLRRRLQQQKAGTR